MVMAETILITGTTGTVGSEVIKQLSRATRDSNIKAAVHSAESVKRAKYDMAEFIPIDYNKPETLKEALKDVDRVFLLTPASPRAAELTFNLVTEARKAGIRYIVRQSIMGVDIEVNVSHLRLHHQAEKIVEETGIPFTLLRPNFFKQNFVNLHGPTIRSDNAFYTSAGNAKVSYVDVRDIARVAVRLLTMDNNGNEHYYKAYNITGPEALSYHDAAEILSNETGRKISYINTSEDQSRKRMKDMGINDWFINTTIELYDFSKAGNLSAVSSAVEEITGKKPISFSQFITDHVRAFQ
jgi:uncharacterized protein YbjT (DUF2867 family)